VLRAWVRLVYAHFSEFCHKKATALSLAACWYVEMFNQHTFSQKLRSERGFDPFFCSLSRAPICLLFPEGVNSASFKTKPEQEMVFPIVIPVPCRYLALQRADGRENQSF
jgi:hypothetical protein